MEEIRENAENLGNNESRGGSGKEPKDIGGINMNEGGLKKKMGIQKPSPETVKRLIEWFSDETG